MARIGQSQEWQGSVNLTSGQDWSIPSVLVHIMSWTDKQMFINNLSPWSLSFEKSFCYAPIWHQNESSWRADKVQMHRHPCQIVRPFLFPVGMSCCLWWWTFLFVCDPFCTCRNHRTGSVRELPQPRPQQEYQVSNHQRHHWKWNTQSVTMESLTTTIILK